MIIYSKRFESANDFLIWQIEFYIIFSALIILTAPPYPSAYTVQVKIHSTHTHTGTHCQYSFNANFTLSNACNECT